MIKAEFLTELDVAEVNDSLWRLTAPLMYRSVLLDRIVTVPPGFLTDFASVPRLPLAYLAAGGKANRPAVIHDYLYRTKPTWCSRAQADAVLREAMAADGQPAWRRFLFWAGVRLFGQIPYDNEPAQEKGQQ